MYNGFSTYTKEGDVLARIEDTHSSLDVDMVDTENWMRIKHIFFLFWKNNLIIAHGATVGRVKKRRSHGVAY